MHNSLSLLGLKKLRCFEFNDMSSICSLYLLISLYISFLSRFFFCSFSFFVFLKVVMEPWKSCSRREGFTMGWQGDAFNLETSPLKISSGSFRPTRPRGIFLKFEFERQLFTISRRRRFAFFFRYSCEQMPATGCSQDIKKRRYNRIGLPPRSVVLI